MERSGADPMSATTTHLAEDSGRRDYACARSDTTSTCKTFWLAGFEGL